MIRLGDAWKCQRDEVVYLPVSSLDQIIITYPAAGPLASSLLSAHTSLIGRSQSTERLLWIVQQAQSSQCWFPRRRCRLLRTGWLASRGGGAEDELGGVKLIELVLRSPGRGTAAHGTR